MQMTKTSDLLNTSQLCAEFATDNKVTQKWLDESGVRPVYTAPYGKGFLRLYEPGPARDAIRARMPKPEPAPVATQPLCLDVVEERLEALAAEVAKLQAQNVVLLRTLESMKGGVEVLVRQLGAEA